MTRTDYAAAARRAVGPSVLRAGKAFLVVRCQDVSVDERLVRITAADVARFYRRPAGCRTLAGLTGDWRPVAALARAAPRWFQVVNVVGLRRASRQAGLVPRF
jgi:hypothetical protein